MFYVYVLECSDGTLYTGYTNDLQGRLEKHNSGKASKYTRSRLPVKIIKSWAFKTKPEAMKREIAFKKLSRNEKIKMLS